MFRVQVRCHFFREKFHGGSCLRLVVLGELFRKKCTGSKIPGGNCPEEKFGGGSCPRGNYSGVIVWGGKNPGGIVLVDLTGVLVWGVKVLGVIVLRKFHGSQLSWRKLVRGEMPGYPYLFEQGKPQKTYLELKV